MADAVHEVLVDDVTDGLLLLDLVLDIGGSGNRVVALGGERAVDQLTSSLDGQGLGNTDGNHGLAGETLSLDTVSYTHLQRSYRCAARCSYWKPKGQPGSRGRAQ